MNQKLHFLKTIDFKVETKINNEENFGWFSYKTIFISLIIETVF